MPKIVANDYGGAFAVLTISAVLLLAGLVHQRSIDQHEQAKQDAITRAQAWIGARAPDEFRRDMSIVDVYAIEPGSIYRVCMPSAVRRRTYCVVVRTHMPFPESVRFAGYEPNAVFAAGAQ